MTFSSYRGKKVLVTGNTGFKGSWLTVWLHLLGARVFGFSDEVPTTPSIYEAAGLKALLHRQFWADISDYASVKQAIEEAAPDVIFHLAAQPIVRESVTHPLRTFQTNILGSATILEAVRAVNPDIPVVMITSDKCYENKEWVWGYRESDRLGGVDPYSASKACAEIIFSSMTRTYSQIKAISARAGNVIGGGDWAQSRVIPDAIRSWEKQEPLVIRSPNATRPWQHVLEPLSGYLLLGEALLTGQFKHVGESYNFGPGAGEDISVKQLITMLKDSWHGHYSVVKFEDERSVEANLLKLNCDKARAQLGWESRWSAAQTVRATAEWYWAYMQKEDLQKLTALQIEAYSGENLT